MFPRVCKHPFKIFIFLLLLTVLCLVLKIRFVSFEKKVKVFSFSHPKLTEHYDTDDISGEVNKHLSILRHDYTKLQELYQIEGTHLQKRTRHVQNVPVRSLLSEQNATKQNIVCSRDLFLLIQVHSSPENFMSRHAIRLSWGRSQNVIGHRQENIAERSWKTVFLIAKSFDPKVNFLVTQEAAIHKDIVIGTFEDTFRNLYKKMILSIYWPLEQNCSASYILKTDEDCFVNIGNLLSWLDSYHTINGTQPIYAGRRQDHMPVRRNNQSRYYLSEKEFPESYFYPYVSGGGYVFSGNLLPLLFNVLKTAPLFPNEDALLGSLMRRISVEPTDQDRFLPFVFCHRNSTEELKQTHMCALSKHIIVHGVKEQQQIRMHYNNALLNSLPSLCSLQDSYENIRDNCG